MKMHSREAANGRFFRQEQVYLYLSEKTCSFFIAMHLEEAVSGRSLRMK